jgi:hypothetical protein
MTGASRPAPITGKLIAELKEILFTRGDIVERGEVAERKGD